MPPPLKCPGARMSCTPRLNRGLKIAKLSFPAQLGQQERSAEVRVQQHPSMASKAATNASPRVLPDL